jgi:hypothetical protein
MFGAHLTFVFSFSFVPFLLFFYFCLLLFSLKASWFLFIIWRDTLSLLWWLLKKGGIYLKLFSIFGFASPPVGEILACWG